MNLFSIAWKSIRQRGLASTLTAFSVALGVMLMVAVLIVWGIVQNTFNQQSINYDLIVGSKGDPLQLVLGTVYHISPPIGNLPYRYFLELKKDPRITHAIPIAMGDTTEKGGFPIVGTVPEFFELDYSPKKEFRVKTKPDGQGFRRPFDAYIGDRVRLENGWDLGTKLKMVHSGAEGHVHDEEFEVVGLLAPTGTPHDKTVYVHLEGFYQVDGHDKPLDQAIINEREFFREAPLDKDQLAAEVARLERIFGKHDHGHEGHAHHGHIHKIPDVQKEVTSILVQCKTPIAANLIAGEMKKKSTPMMAVNPIQPMKKLLTEFLGPVETLLLVLTTLIVLVSGIGIFVSIYNSMSARRREIAIMRALGAQRSTVLSIILAESVMLCVGGGLLGLLLGHGLVFAAAPVVAAKTGLIIDPREFSSYELILFPILFLLGVLVGFLPGVTAYKTDVAEALSNG